MTFGKSILIIVALYILTRVLIILVEVVRNKKTNLLSNKMLNELRSKIFNKVLSLKINDFEKFPSSDIYTRLTVDAENVKTLFSEDIPVILNDIVNIVFMFITMFIINTKLAFIGTIITIVFAINESLIIKKLKQIQKQTVKKRDLQNKEYSETYNKSKLTKFFSLEDKNIDKVNKLLKEELKLRYKHIWIDSLPWPISVLVEAITMYAILYYVLNIDSGISLGTVYIFLYYIRQCFSPLKELFNQIEEIQTSQVSLERINTILSIQEKEEINKGLNIENLKGNIEFNNVSFAYDKQSILSDISFKISAGEKTAIVGRTRCR
jgi:ABC transporter related